LSLLNLLEVFELKCFVDKILENYLIKQKIYKMIFKI